MELLLELLSKIAQIGEMNADELESFLTDLESTVADIDAEGADDETVAALVEAGEGATAARARLAELAEEADARAERARAAIEAIRGGADDGDDDGEDAEVTEAEAEGDDDAGDDDGEDEGGEGDVDADDSAEGEPVAVAAAGAPAKRPRISKVAARRPAATKPAPRSTEPDLETWGLVASANMNGKLQPGEALDSPDKLAEAFIHAFEMTRGYHNGPRVKIPVARSMRQADVARELTLDGMDVGGNTRKVEQVQKVIRREGGIQNALTAAGGPCAPSEVRYDLPVLGTDARPVRDEMLARFAATRGGIRTLPPPVLSELAGAVAVWDDDANNGAGQTTDAASTKPCLSITCPDEDETIVDAVTRCLEFGNFRRAYFPEQVEAWMTLAAAQHARIAETRLLTTIGTNSTAVTAPTQVLGSTRHVLAVLDRAAAGFRSRHRTGRGFPLRFGAPAWLLDNIRTDLARELPGSSDERLAVADATIESFFAVRNINPTWFLDGESGQVFPAQAVGTLRAWPSTVITYLYPDGSHLFLDGGVLDLGLVRDSTLNSTNDVQMFAETMEAAHFHGTESLKITIDICPDGSTSAAVDIDPCTTGS